MTVHKTVLWKVKVVVLTEIEEGSSGKTTHDTDFGRPMEFQ